jgi:DNA-directed RNA polymerase sigma subunit (sigma70/sigma32)
MAEYDTVSEPIRGKLRACAPMSFEDIAYTIGVSKQRAQQICDNALRKARRIARARGINIEEFFRD